MSAKKRKPAAKKHVAKKQAAKTEESPRRSFWFGSVLLVTAAQLLVLGARHQEGRPLHLMDLVPFLFWLLSSLILVTALRAARYRGSVALLAGALLLSGIGVVVRARMSGTAENVRDMHLLIQPLGFALLFLAWMVVRKDRHGLLRPFWALSALAILAMAGLMLVIGSRFRGGVYAPGGMTPTEILKLFLPVALAGFFTWRDAWEDRPVWNPPFTDTLLLGIFWMLLCALLVLHRDLGLVLLLSLTALAVLIVATRRASWGILAVAALGGGAFLVLRFFTHGARRFEAWLNPFADPTGSGWQVLQGLSGLYAGGLLGTGFGSGRPDRLPIASSDFVYAVYAEEVGYLGSLLLLLLFALLFRAGMNITRQQDEEFARLLAAGLTASLALQTLVNIAGVVQVLPVTGITLPYISQGGSSYWVTSVQIGLLLGLSDRKR